MRRDATTTNPKTTNPKTLILNAQPNPPGTTATTVDIVEAVLAGLNDTVDAAGDVLIAEAVHHLVGGSPLRAGLTADTLGKAIPPPERLDAMSTPTGAVTVTHSLALAVAIPAPGTGPWPAGTGTRAILDPAAEAIAAWALGSPDDWRIQVSDPDATLTSADLGLSAIDLVVELTTPQEHSALAGRARPGGLNALAVVRADGHGGPDAAPQLAAAVRALLSRCRALPDPRAALDPGADAAAAGDLDELAGRITGWWSGVHDTLNGWTPGSDPAAQTATLTELARLGLAGVRFDSPPSTGQQLSERWSDTPALITAPPGAPSITDATAWLLRAVPAVRKAAGDWFTGAVTTAADPDGGPALRGDTPASGAADPDVDDWIRAHYPLCAGVGAVSDMLSLSGACGAAHPPEWVVRQQLTDTAASGGWVATSHPGTRSATSLSALRIDAAGPPQQYAVLMVDTWAETVPPAPPPPAPAGSPPTPTDPEQQAALALRFDSPDSRAPQAVLLATAPDPQRGWRAADLHAVVEETLWWAMARPLDTDDLPEQEGHTDG